MDRAGLIETSGCSAGIARGAAQSEPSARLERVQPAESAEAREGETQGPAAHPRLMILEVIRSYAITIVILAHVVAPLLKQLTLLGRKQWLIAMAYDGLTRPASTLFLMASGMLLLDQRYWNEKPAIFLGKRFRKVVIPLLGWSVIYLLWRHFVNEEPMTVVKAMKAILRGPVSHHLWFVYAIVGLYLVTPILRVYISRATRRDLTYFCGLWFVMVGIFPAVKKLFNIQIGIPAYVATAYVGYFVAGYWLRNVVLTRRQAILVIVGLAVNTAVLIGATYYYTARAGGRLDPFFRDRTSLTGMIGALGWFLLLKSVPVEPFLQKHRRVNQFVMSLSACRMGIYLCHILVLTILEDGLLGIRLNVNDMAPIVGVPFITLVTLAGSYALTALLRRVPYLRILTP